MSLRKLRDVSVLLLATVLSIAAAPSPWPPQVGHAYPDLEMIDQTGQKVRLSSFKGKVLVIEPIGMTCEACVAWSGSEKYGAYNGQQGQQNVSPIEDMFSKYAGGIAYHDPRIVHIQLLLFNEQNKPTTAVDAKAWAAHFHRDRAKNDIVLAGSADLLATPYYQASYNLIPGFQLIDKDFILRSDSTSDNPKTNLWTELLPMVPGLVQDVH